MGKIEIELGILITHEIDNLEEFYISNNEIFYKKEINFIRKSIGELEKFIRIKIVLYLGLLNEYPINNHFRFYFILKNLKQKIKNEK